MAAMDSVLRTTELFENILSFLDPDSLHAAMQTNKTFRAACEGSSKLKALSFRVSEPNMNHLPPNDTSRLQACGVDAVFNTSLTYHSEETRNISFWYDEEVGPFAYAYLPFTDPRDMGNVEISHARGEATIDLVSKKPDCAKNDGADMFQIVDSDMGAYTFYPLLPISLRLEFRMPLKWWKKPIAQPIIAASIKLKKKCRMDQVAHFANAIYRCRPQFGEPDDTDDMEDEEDDEVELSDIETFLALEKGGLSEKDMDLVDGELKFEYTYVDIDEPVWRVQ